jgi:Tfp pilus assembly protein PilF
MTSQFKKYSVGLFLCVAASLFIHTSTSALDKRSAFALSHYIMAVMYDQLGEIDNAIAEYKKAIKADYKNAVIHLNLAASYIKKEQIPKAIEELKLSAELDPEAVEPHAILALLYSSGNKLDEAGREYEFALKNASKLEPKNIDIYKSLGAIYLQQKKFKDAEETFRLILNLSPDDAEAHFYLGGIYDEQKDRQKAEKELKKAIELKADYHEALNYLGYLYVEENRNLETAETMIRKALELDSDNGAYIDSLGWLYFKRGKIKEALKELEKASALLADPVIYEHLGDAYFKTKELEKARANWQESLKLDPHQDKVKKKIEGLK